MAVATCPESDQVRQGADVAAICAAGAHFQVMKIYTKTGDDGQTGLIGGERVSKADLQMEAIGTVDELNSTIGLVRSHLDETSLIFQPLLRIQHQLFDLGAELASIGADSSRFESLHDGWITQLEAEIDSYTDQLEPLREFILPGGSIPAAFLHQARCVCRRAERVLVAFGEKGHIRPITVQYLNRLSDWTFVAARLVNAWAGIADVKWSHDHA